MGVEWTEQQQLLFFVQSIGLGLGIGFLFDGMTGIGRACRRKWFLFLLDVLFGVLAALITFFASLAIMDGQLHPLLFAGGLVGFLAEHVCIGVYGSRLVCCVLRFVVSVGCRLLDGGEQFLLKAAGLCAAFFRRKPLKSSLVEKNRKNFRFFQKKT